MTLRDPQIPIPKLFSLAHAGFAYRPTGIFVIPFTLAFAVLLVTTFSLARHIASPSRIAPFRFFPLPDDQNRKRLTIAQLFLYLKYGRLTAGLLAPRLLSDAAFLALWSTAFVHVISAHHTLPLLRSTPTHDPPQALQSPLLRPFSTTATLVFFPLLVLGSLASADIYDHVGITVLHDTIRESSQLFADAPSTTVEQMKAMTILGPDSYAEMQAHMAQGWRAALKGSDNIVKLSAIVILIIALLGTEARAYWRYWYLSKNARREQRLTLYSSNTLRASKKRSGAYFRPTSRHSNNREHAFVPTLPFHQPPPASLPMCRTASRASTASSSTSTADYSDLDYEQGEAYHLRSATPYGASTPLQRSRSSDSDARRFSPTATASSDSTRLPYRVLSPLRSSSLDSTLSESMQYLPELATATPTSDDSASAHDQAVESQRRELEKCRLDRPRSVARRPGRQMSWEAPGEYPLGSVEERRSYDTLPMYASRAGSQKIRRSHPEATKNEDDAEYEVYEVTSAEMSVRSWSAGSYESSIVNAGEKVQEISCDMVEDEKTGGYAGPSSRVFEAMRNARVADALWSLGIMTVFAILFVAKALWAEQIASSASLSSFILVFEHTLPSTFLFVYFSITYCRRASARVDQDLYKKTRWARDLNEEGWWIPVDEANASSKKSVG
ncbi:uncharacterized protein JCM15063_002501 [Sporobolomyces koalae]|uniref:uncharacterized protein n=1 Tax=Sporobolomyces koalae TaxID=500713 RepID=UPI00317E0C63